MLGARDDQTESSHSSPWRETLSLPLMHVIRDESHSSDSLPLWVGQAV